MDPFACLNHDCVSQILGYLHPVDVVRLESVSTHWRDMIRWFGAAIGRRVHFPDKFFLQDHTIVRTDDDILHNYGDYKDSVMGAQTRRNLASGAATSIRRFSAAYHFVVSGEYIAWCDFEESIAIRLQKRNGKHGKLGPTRRLTVKELTKGVRLQVSDLLLNEDGILVVQLKDNRHTVLLNPKVILKHVVYHIDRKRVLSQITSKGVLEVAFGNFISHPTPLALGRRHIYYAKPLGNRYELMAMDFSGQVLYHKPSIGEQSDIPTFETHQRKKIFEVLQTKRGEVLIQLDSSRVFQSMSLGSGSCRVIDGATGKEIQLFKYSPTGKGCVASSISDTTFTITDTEGSPIYRHSEIFADVKENEEILEMMRRWSNEPHRGVFPNFQMYYSRTYTLQEDNKFSQTSSKVIVAPGFPFQACVSPLGSYCISTGYRSLPYVAAFEQRIVSKHQKDRGVDALSFCENGQKNITLPARTLKNDPTESPPQRRPFDIVMDRNNISISYVDESRTFIQQTTRRKQTSYWEVFLFDFGVKK